MEINITIPKKILEGINTFLSYLLSYKGIVLTSLVLAITASTIAFFNDVIVTYGDAESHLNIAKRVIHSITPGAAQLGGIWLPIPHLLLVPFVSIDWLWRTGLAGSIVSGISFIIAGIYLYKTTLLLTKNKAVSFISFLVFALNPNVLYLQATPMTEVVLIMFFILSTYYYIQFVMDRSNILMLIIAAFFTFCATLTRYDGWFLAVYQALGIGLLYVPTLKKDWSQLEGKVLMFSTLAFFGIGLWFLWGRLILGDALYFTSSEFSARTQQINWYERGELPSYHNIVSAFSYYFITAMSNTGVIFYLGSLFGFILYLRKKFTLQTLIIAGTLVVPFIFNVITLFLGQSVIFIPHLTPVDFEWRLFNVRYGVMMAPTVALFFAYLFQYKSPLKRGILVILCIAQAGLFLVGYSKIVSLADGTEGLSKSKRPDAERWIRDNYDEGLVLMDDYARTISVVRSGIPMQNIIYIGNQEYWTESFVEPEKYATWIVMQRDDSVWTGIYDDPHNQGRLFKYFQKVYTSPDILIFKRNIVPDIN